MSIESFSIISLDDEFLVKLMSENLQNTVSYDYPYERCIAEINLKLREEYKERAYHEINELPAKLSYYDEEQQRFVDDGRILLRTDHFDFTLYPGVANTVRLKKHPRDNNFSIPFEEGDITQICEGLVSHHIKIPKTLELDLITNISVGKKKQISKTVSYPPEEGVMANIADKVSHTLWSYFGKTK